MSPNLVAILGVVIAALSFVAASMSAKYARMAATSADKQAESAEQQAQFQYFGLLSTWEPAVDLAVESVDYRWATADAIMIQKTGEQGGPGSATHPKVPRGTVVNIKEATECGIAVEIIIRGSLRNRSKLQQLITVRGANNRWNPLLNEQLFIVDGQEINSFVLDADTEVEFIWCDRRSVDEWRQLYREFNPTLPAWDENERNPENKTLMEKLHKAADAMVNLTIGEEKYRREQVSEKFSFTLVAEPRIVERVATIWRVAAGRSAIRPVGGDEFQDWQLVARRDKNVDDDSVIYRCGANTALASLKAPRSGIQVLPGRGV